MKLVNYRCEICEKDHDEYFTTEEMEEGLDQSFEGKCECGGDLKPFLFKNNQQVWKYLSSHPNK